MTPRDVVAALRAEGLEVEYSKRSSLVMVSFEVDEERVPVFAIVPDMVDDDPKYFLLISPAVTPRPIEQLSAPTLRELIKASSDVELAKLVYQEMPDHSFFAAVSECSVEAYTGKKLRLRMEACARLARQIAAIQG